MSPFPRQGREYRDRVAMHVMAALAAADMASPIGDRMSPSELANLAVDLAETLTMRIRRGRRLTMKEALDLLEKDDEPR